MSTRSSLQVLLLLLPATWAAWAGSVLTARSGAITKVVMHAQRGDGRRTSRVGQLVRQELSEVIRTSHSIGSKRIPAGLQHLISVVDVDMSPDLRNARVKVSIIGERKDKITAVRWLQGNVRGLRHELAQRNRGMKRIPMLSFMHVDVGAATDMMVKLEELKREQEAAALARGEDPDEDYFDFDASDEEAWDDGDDEGALHYDESDLFLFDHGDDADQAP